MFVKAIEAGAAIEDEHGATIGTIVNVTDHDMQVHYLLGDGEGAAPMMASVEDFEAWGITGEGLDHG